MKLIFITTLLLFSLRAPDILAWGGYSYDKGKFVDIEKGSLVRDGNEIEIYDYDKGTYQDVEVKDIDGRDVTYTDPDTGEDITIEMDQ